MLSSPAQTLEYSPCLFTSGQKLPEHVCGCRPGQVPGSAPSGELWTPASSPLDPSELREATAALSREAGARGQEGLRANRSVLQETDTDKNPMWLSRQSEARNLIFFKRTMPASLAAAL